MNKIYSTFGKSLKKHLDEKNKTQRDLADYMGVTEATVSCWVNGVKMPRMNKIDKICEYLNITRESLFGNEMLEEIRLDTLQNVYKTLASMEGISEEDLKKAVAIVKGLK